MNCDVLELCECENLCEVATKRKSKEMQVVTIYAKGGAKGRCSVGMGGQLKRYLVEFS